MTVLGKIRNSIAHRNGHVVLRSELSKFGCQSQLTAALTTLINHGELVRMGPGIFAKANASHSTPSDWTFADSKATFQEAFDKLHINVTFLDIEQHEELYHCIVHTGKRRFTKPLQLGNYAVVYSKNDGDFGKTESLEVPTDLDQLPNRNVGEYILSLARSHKVATQRSRLDGWAEAVTRAAGDSVHLDKVGQTLVALFKAHLVNGRQMSRLMSNYMLEKKRSDTYSSDSRQLSSRSADKEYSLP